MPFNSLYFELIGLNFCTIHCLWEAYFDGIFDGILRYSVGVFFTWVKLRERERRDYFIKYHDLSVLGRQNMKLREEMPIFGIS